MFTSKQPPIEGAALVRTVFSPVEAAIIEDLLRQAGIASIRRPKYGLDPLPVLAGFSALGEEIYVAAENEGESLEIIAAYLDGAGEIIENGNEENRQ